MRELLVSAILVVGAPLIGWSLVQGLRTGTMDAAGVPYASFTRAKQPIMFWMAAAFNAAVCLGAIVFLIGAGLSNT